MKSFNCFVWRPVYANSLSAFVPQWWAMESLMILNETLVVSNLVHRDFENQVQNFGDTVNTRKPARFSPKRKNATSNVTVQDATATNVAIKLNQWMHTSFQLNDSEMGLSLPTLLQTYLRPAIQAVARGVDQAVIGQFYQAAAAANYAGNLGNSVTQARVIELREAMTSNLCPLEGRNLVVPPNMEGQILGIDNFVRADAIGGGESRALRNGEIGRIMGFDTFMSQMCPQITLAPLNKGLVTINNAAGYPAGTTGAITVTGNAADSLQIVAGMFITIAGDDTPLYVKAITSTTGITIGTGTPLKRAIANGAAVTGWYAASRANFGAGYASGWAEPVVIDTGTIAPVTGQAVQYLGSSAAVESDRTKNYGVMEGSTATSLLTNRPADAAITDNDFYGWYPGGNYGFAFRREAVGLIARPLPPTHQMSGVRSAVVSENGLSLRVTITYDGNAQKHLVTIDGIFGVQTFDTAMIGILLG